MQAFKRGIGINDQFLFPCGIDIGNLNLTWRRSQRKKYMEAFFMALSQIKW
jgi:hypothetical protein